MDPIIGGSLIGAGGSLAGGLLGSSAAKEAQARNEAIAAANIAMQKEFAQNGIRWKVEDAKAAGIHPLYALGAQGASFSPVSVGATPDTSMASAMADMGQNIGRAVGATRTESEKVLHNITVGRAQAELDGQLIDNQIKAAQLSALQKPAAPAFPGSTNFIPGQGNSGLQTVKPSERTASQTGRLAQEAGWVPDVGYARTDTGMTPVPSQDVKNRIEDQLIPELMWSVRNQLMPNLTGSGSPPLNQLPDGAYGWKWNVWKQEWQPKYRPKTTVPFGGHR